MSNDVVSSLRLTVDSLSNGGDLLCVGFNPVTRYFEGKPTGEQDYRCTVVAPKNGYMRYDVVVQHKPEVVIAEGDSVPVVFEGLELKLYRTWQNNAPGGHALSAKAKALHTVVKKQ